MSGYYTDPFWDYLYQLRQTGVLCDIQLFVKNQQDEFVSIFAHKVILAASSYYFQSCLSQGELLDIYNFDGIHVDNLQIVLDYMYHQISWSELQCNAEATIAAKTLGIMEQTSPPDPVLDRSVLKDTDGNKVLLVKRFSTGRKANSNGAAKTSSMSKRVILPHEEIAKLIVNRRNTKPSPQARLGKLGMDELGDHGNNERPDGTVNTIRLVDIPREDGEMMNLEESPQQAMFDSDPAPSNLPLHSPNHHVNTVVVDQQGIVTMYAQEVGEIRPGEADAGCQHTALLQGVEDPKPCDQHCEQQLASLSSEKEQMFLSVSSEQESVLADGHSDRTPEAADQDCHEVTTGITGSDIITGDTDIPTGANAEDEMIAAIVDDVSEDQIQSGDATPAISGDVEIPTASIDNAVTLQTVSSGEDCKTDVRRQALGDGDITVTYHDDNLKVNKTPKPVEIETESVPPDDDRPAAQKKQPTTGRAVGKQRLHREKATNLTHIDTPTRSRRIRRPPSDKIYEWSLPSMRRHDNEPTKVPSEVSNVEAPVESSTKEPARQTRTRLRVVVKKETESNSGTAPSKDTSEGAELVMSLGDGEKTMTRTRSKRKAILLELEEVPGNGNGGNKKTKVVPEEEESDDMSPAMQTVSTRISKDAEDDTPEGTPVIPVKRRRGRPKIKKEIKMEQLEDSNESESDAIRRSLAESNIQMESNSGPCVCSWCGKVFKNNTGLCIHENWVHKGLGQREGSTTHECTICNKVCKSFAALRNHEMQKHKMEREWPCETCGNIFRKAKELKKHRMREHKEERYECDVCQAMFISREGWKIHMYKQHTDAKPCHMCEVCGKVFKMKHELKIHCKITHSTRRDFACQLCERSFKNNVTLTRHLLTYHSNVRNYHCDVCNRAFKTNMDMKKHRERHFRENDPLTKEGKRVRKHPDGLDYPCQFCGKVFYKRYLATAHENLQHRQKDQGVSYTCTVCNKVFPIKHYLMQHISNKHRPRRFKCLRCQREFAQQYELRKHQQQPGRCQGRPDFMKPYECEHCGRKFTLKGNLTKHMQAAGRCKRVHQAQVIDYIVVVEQDGDAEPAGHASEESLETAEALATLQTAQALQLLQNPETQHTSSELPGNQEMQMLQELDGTVVMEESEAGEGALGEAQGMGEEDMGTMLHITDGEGGDGQVHILEIHPGEGNEQTQQIEISEELVAQLGGTQENIIVQIVPADRQGAQGYEETR